MPTLSHVHPDLPASAAVPDRTALAAASLSVRTLLRDERRDVEVVAAFPHAVYLTAGDDLLALVTADGVLLPNALALTASGPTRPLSGLHRGQHGRVGQGRLDIGRWQVRVSRWWDPRPRLRTARVGTLRAAAADAEARMAARWGLPPVALTAPLAAVKFALAARDGDAALAGAARLVGLGPGLTPAGDDVLCGLLSGVQLLAPTVDAAPAGGQDLAGQPDVAASTARDLGAATADLGAEVADLARDRTTVVSAALLRHAARAEVAAPAAALLRALTGHGDLGIATHQLLAVGSTSGRDLTLGLLAAADVVTSTVAGSDQPRSGRTP